jgi:hypothetical protein
MNRFTGFCLTLLLAGTTLAGLSSAGAASWSWVMSIPHAISDQQLYKVRILEVDGTAQQELLRYDVGPGRHELTVQLMLDLEWEPDLTEGDRRPPIKRMTLEVEAGKSYVLAGKVDIDAPVESQLDQSWWEPVVYAVQ